MKYLSVCSGIEAATVAWHPLGWHPLAFCEVDKFPSAVLAHHYQDVPNWGDMTKFHEWPDAAIDVLVGGTPCQSFSVAGLRKGLDDPRGNLMLTYLAIADKYRPAWLVWENVPGVLSSNRGRDFGTFLGALGKLGYGFAYRVLDAQYFGVPQRRRRVFVVGHLGDWRRAAAVLFERHSLSGDSPPRRTAWEDITGSTGDGIARCITTGEAKRQDWETCNFVTNTAPTIPSRRSAGGGLGTDFDCDGGLIAYTLRGEGFDASEDGTGRGTPLVPVAFDCKAGANTGFAVGEVPGALRGNGHGGGHAAIATMSAVRRITPVEAERLQGFPDHYTAIPWRGKPADQCPDGLRYKALGNSMAVPVMSWIGERIALVNAIPAMEDAAA